MQGRLRQQGLALAPFGGNIATLACYAFSQALACHLTDDPDFATLPLAALLLLLSQVLLSAFSDQFLSSQRLWEQGRLNCCPTLNGTV